MTSNLVESQNNVYKGTRGLPITAIVKASYYRLAALFAKRGHEAAARVNSGEPFSENIMTDKSMRREKKGRPPITRIRTEMDDVETERRCGVCRMPGHSRKNCINIRHQ